VRNTRTYLKIVDLVNTRTYNYAHAAIARRPMGTRNPKITIPQGMDLVLKWYTRTLYSRLWESAMNAVCSIHEHTASRLRKNSLVHWAKPVEHTIFAGVKLPQHGQFVCPGRSECSFRTSLEIIPGTGTHASQEAEKRFSAAC